jgi:hypothetical protein
MIKSIDEPFQKVFDITTKLTTIQVYKTESRS